MTTQHTPGPWHLEEMTKVSCGDMRSVEGRSVCGSDGITVFHLPYAGRVRNPSTRADADAALIAAAPTMLEALQAVLSSDIPIREEDEGEVSPVLEMAREAVAIATALPQDEQEATQ